ncbi:Nn.00g113950.m01.CDS01 [Neocucurbitaria sp. VM-36]
MSALARSLISDLRLDRPQNPSGCPSIGPHVENNEPQTNEGRRLLIAVFGLSAMISTIFRYDLAPWSYPIEEACDKLAKDEEAEGDRILIDAARISRITLNAAEVARRASDDPRLAEHVTLAIGPLKSSLDSLMNTLTAESLKHNTIIAYLCNAEVNIYELSLIQPPPSYQYPSDFKRIEYLTSCLQSCKAGVDYFLAADTDIAYISGPCMLIFAHSLKVLYKLSTLNHDSGWDPKAVRETVDIVRALEQAAAVTEQSNARIKEQTGEDSVLAAAAVSMRSTAPNWRIEEVAVDDATKMSEWIGGGGVDPSFIEFSDNLWLSGAFDF